MKHVLIFADTDSRLKWATWLARFLADDGDRVSADLIICRTTPTPQQREDAGATYPIREAHLATTLSSPALYQADVVVGAVTGPLLFHVLQYLHDHFRSGTAAKRPVVVAGYEGVVLEKHVTGLCWRLGADVVCVNSAVDEDLLGRIARDLGHAPRLVRTGFSHVGALEPPRTPSEIGTVTFAVQPSIPPAREARRYVIRRLHEYATAFPERRVLVKLRARHGETTTYPERHRYDRMLERLGLEAPPNLEFVYGAMPEVLARTDLCITVSSTAAMEALARGIPTAIVSDMGVKEVLGNHYFIGSGCNTSFDALMRDEVPTPSSSWLAHNGLSPDDHPRNLRRAVDELLSEQAEVGAAPPPRPPYYAEAEARFVVDKLTSDLADDFAQALAVAPKRPASASPPPAKPAPGMLAKGRRRLRRAARKLRASAKG